MKLARNIFFYGGTITAIACAALLVKCKSDFEKDDKFSAVIENYSKNPADSLKLRAAKFLIKNLAGQMTLDTASVESNQVYFDLIYNTWLHEKMRIGFRFPVQTRVIDSINKADHLPQKLPETRYVNDAELVTADFIIKNVDNAFQVWRNMPWAKDVSFHDFCNYILPYRTSPTYSLDAREFFMTKYKHITDSVKSTRNPFVAKDFVCKEIDRWFQEDPSLVMRYPYLQPVKFSNLLKGKIGDCHDANSVRITAMRAVGIPVVMDMVPNWGNSNMTHYWFKVIHPTDTVKSLLTNENVRRPMQHIVTATSYDDPDYGERPKNIQIRYCRTVPKVYRRCFERQSGSLAALKSVNDEVPGTLNNAWMRDVTEKYVQCADVKIKLRKSETKQKFAYLCVFDNQKWEPVAWGEVSGLIATFKAMGKNIVYLPAYYQAGDLIPAGLPFLLDGRGKAIGIKSSSNTEAVTILAKYPIKPNEMTNEFAMVGGRFQLANKADLSDTVTCHTVKNLHFNQTELRVNKKGKYRYLVFQFKGISITQMSELSFYGRNADGKEVRLTGKVIGNKGLYPYVTERIFDGNRATYFKSSKLDSSTYIGIDLGKGNASNITRITYMPHTDDNNVVTGDSYQLSYWNGEWLSLGIQEAKSQNRVIFNKVPKNSLLLVENTAGGKEQRIFQYKSGHQIFW